MILGFDAVVADTAVVAAWGTPDVAGFAVFGRHFKGAVLGGRGTDHDPVCCWRAEGERIFSRVGWGKGVKVAREDLVCVSDVVEDEEWLLLTPGFVTEAWMKDDMQM